MLQELRDRCSLLGLVPQAALERVEQVGPDLEAVLGELLAAPTGRHGVVGEGDAVSRVRDGGDLEADVAQVREGRAAVDHLVQDAAERPHVGGASELREGDEEAHSQCMARRRRTRRSERASERTFMSLLPPWPSPVSLSASGGM